MKDILKYIFVLAVISLMSSCRLEEPFEPVLETPACSEIELIARPTGFIKTDVATKATSEEIEAIEYDIHTAYFLLYDRDGRLLRYENLTDKITDRRTVPSQTIPADRAYTDVTVCYIANLPEKTVRENMTATEEDKLEDASFTDLQKLQSAVIKLDYDEGAENGLMGVPGFDLDGRATTDDVLCLPMVGVWTGDLTGASGESAVEIMVKRLFAKIRFTVNLALADGTENASLAFEYFTIKNVPEKVALFPSESESAWVTALSSNFSNFPVPEGAATIELGESITFDFYVPEYMLEPDITGYESQDWYKNKIQNYKPLLVGRGNKATHVEFFGVLSRPGQDMMLTYKIYLGGNNFDDFSMKRNYLYDNIISILGTSEGDNPDEMMTVDHRVNIQYDGFLVGFQRATLLDSHFEVRPLRVKFPKSFIEENRSKGGTLTVEILEPETHKWLRLERPTKAQLTASNAPYCLSGNKYSHTKRKYFTTDLVESTLADNTIVSYDPFDKFDGATYTGGDLSGEIPVWVYIDEYGASSSADYSADAVRKATIRVTFTPNGGGETIYRDFTVQQRAIYPIASSGQPGHTYGIEYFEEYLHDYDSQDNYGAEGGEYFTSQNGIPWGFEGEQFSDTDWALYFTENRGWINVDDWANAATAHLNLNYDFYLTRDKDSEDDAITLHDYSGYEFNQKILTKENIHNINRTLNQNTESVVEYCYNKNKRNSDGKVVYQYNTDQTAREPYPHKEYYSVQETYLIIFKRNRYYEITWDYNALTKHTYTHTNSDNLKWFAPAIDELEDIVENGVSIDFFREVFEENLYWSSQPAYHRNYFQYIIGIEKAEAGGFELDFSTILSLFGLSSRQRTGGVYMSDNTEAARATKYDPVSGSFISSDITSDNPQEGYYKATTLFGTVTADNYKYYPNDDDGDIVYDLENTLILHSLTDWDIDWDNGDQIAATSYKKTDGITKLQLPEGIQPRTSEHRVRCIYNPETKPEVVVETKVERSGYEYLGNRRVTYNSTSPVDGIDYKSITTLPNDPQDPPK